MEEKKIKQTKIVRYGIIGCGGRAEKYAQAIAKEPRSKLEAIFDIELPKSRLFASRYGGAVILKLESILNHPGVDIIIVTTPHDTHVPITLSALRAEKYILCEKPLGISLRECEAVINSPFYKKNVFVGLQTRFSTPVQLLSKLLKQKSLGKIFTCDAVVRKHRDKDYFNSWRSSLRRSGGILFTHGIHAIDLMAEFCGEPEEAYGLARNFRNFKGMEDVFKGVVRFKNGSVGNIDVSILNKDSGENQIFIQGERGIVKIGGPTFNRFEHFQVAGERFMKNSFDNDKDSCDLSFIGAIADYILSGKKKKNSLLPFAEVGVRATRFIQRLQE